MSIRDDQKTVAAVVSRGLHDLLQKEAHMAGLTMSKHIANILSEYAVDELATDGPPPTHKMDNRGRVKIPAKIVAALNIEPATTIAFYPFHRGVLMRPMQ